MLSCQCQVQCQESWERRKYLIVDEIIITQLMTEKKSKKNTKREIRKVIYRIHSVVFCVWKMNLSSQSYFMVQCIMSHSGSVWHLFLGERCTTILKKKKKYAIFGQCDLYYFLRRYLTSWQSANIPAPVYSIGLPKKKAVYHVFKAT